MIAHERRLKKLEERRPAGLIEIQTMESLLNESEGRWVPDTPENRRYTLESLVKEIEE